MPELPMAESIREIAVRQALKAGASRVQLGVHANVVIASVPEGADKPYKFANIYRGIDALVLNKCTAA
jgi:hypothetical protein